MKGEIDFKALALQLDAQRDPLVAAWAYEIAITSDDAESDAFLNLALIYFQCADFGYATANLIPDAFANSCLTRAFEILTIVKDRIGDSTEIEFWTSYFSSVYFEEKGIQDKCRQLADKGDSLLPFTYLFVAGESQYVSQARELLKIVRSGLTERERYIKSLIQGALHRL